MDSKSDISANRSPSRMSNYVSKHRQENSFSIDYILSNSSIDTTPKDAGKHTENRMLDELNLKSQRRAQLMAAVSTASQQHQQHQQQSMTASRMGEIERQPAAGSTAVSNPQINQPYPNFLYFMACMLLQQQQHQQQQQQQHRQQKQVEQQQQLIVQQLARSQQQQQQQQLVTSPIDSLAVLARLTGAVNGNAADDGAGGSSGAQLGRNPNRLHSNQALTRHHPYHHSQATDRSHPGYMGSMLQMDMNSRASKLGSSMQLGLNHCLSGTGSSSNQSPADAHISTGGKYHLSDNSSLTTTTSTSCGNNLMQCKSPHEKLDNLKPAHSYIGLIGMCILSSPEKRMVLNDIYQFILDNYPYYRNRGSGWRNSVRHNLSLNECFQKAGRAANGKGHYWTIHPANLEDFMMGDFRRRRAQRKVRRWNNMDVPSDESEDESVEDATKPPLPEHFKRSLEMHKRLERSIGFHHKTNVMDIGDGNPLGLLKIPPSDNSEPMSLMMNQATRTNAEHVFGSKQEL